MAHDGLVLASIEKFNFLFRTWRVIIKLPLFIHLTFLIYIMDNFDRKIDPKLFEFKRVKLKKNKQLVWGKINADNGKVKSWNYLSLWWVEFEFDLTSDCLQVLLKWVHPIIFLSNVFHISHLIYKCIQNQQQLLILYTLLNQMRVMKNIRRKDDRITSLYKGHKSIIFRNDFPPL